MSEERDGDERPLTESTGSPTDHYVRGGEPSGGYNFVRYIVPGAVVLVTARILSRQFLLRADEILDQLVQYYLFHYASLFGVEIVQLTIMSNHIHLVVIDRFGLLPAMMMNVDRSIAQDLHKHHGIKGQIFEQDPDYLVLSSVDSIVDKVAYSIANPVAAGAVERPEQWPSVCTRAEDIDGERRTFERSPYRSSKRTVFPAQAEGRLVLPEALVDKYGSPEAARAVIEQAVEEKVRAAHAEMAAAGRRFQGAAYVRSLDPHTVGVEEEEPGPRRRVRFSMLGLSPEQQLAILAGWLLFQATYRECRRRYLKGEDVIWPHGTWAMVRYHGQRVAPPPPG